MATHYIKQMAQQSTKEISCISLADIDASTYLLIFLKFALRNLPISEKKSANIFLVGIHSSLKTAGKCVMGALFCRICNSDIRVSLFLTLYGGTNIMIP